MLDEDDISKLSAKEEENGVEDSSGLGKNRGILLDVLKMFYSWKIIIKLKFTSNFYCNFCIDNSDRAFYKELVKVIEASDVILEVLDARDPLGTRCIDMEKMVIKSGPEKHLVLLLNKIGNVFPLHLPLSCERSITCICMSTHTQKRFCLDDGVYFIVLHYLTM